MRWWVKFSAANGASKTSTSESGSVTAASNSKARTCAAQKPYAPVVNLAPPASAPSARSCVRFQQTDHGRIEGGEPLRGSGTRSQWWVSRDQLLLQVALVLVEQGQRDGRRAGVAPVERSAPDPGGGGDVVHGHGPRVVGGEHRGCRGKDLGSVARRIRPLGADSFGTGVVGRKQVYADVHHCTVTDDRNKWTKSSGCPAC